MPTYEYECQSCHQRVEAVQKFSDAPLSVCEHCGGELRKVFSGVGIVFKVLQDRFAWIVVSIDAASDSSRGVSPTRSRPHHLGRLMGLEGLSRLRHAFH